LYLLAGDADDITPKEQVFEAANLFGTPKNKIEKVLAKGGHIGLFMGATALTKNWPAIAEWILKNENNKA
jgi:poly(3-hydroxybutyrate) depolymerase